MTASAFKLFGLQRSGTNLVRRGVLANFRVASAEHGREWKHGRIKQSATDGLAILVCSRGPLAWLDAMYRFARRVHDRDGCPHFRREWTFHEFCMRPHYGWANPMLRWNELYRHYVEWLARHPAQGLLVRSEDLLGLGNQGNEFTRIGVHFGWSRVDTCLHTFARRVRHAGPPLGERMDWSYYLEKKYLDAYTGELQRKVLETFDRALVTELGYEGDYLLPSEGTIAAFR